MNQSYPTLLISVRMCIDISFSTMSSPSGVRDAQIAFVECLRIKGELLQAVTAVSRLLSVLCDDDPLVLGVQ